MQRASTIRIGSERHALHRRARTLRGRVHSEHSPRNGAVSQDVDRHAASFPFTIPRPPALSVLRLFDAMAACRLAAEDLTEPMHAVSIVDVEQQLGAGNCPAKAIRSQFSKQK